MLQAKESIGNIAQKYQKSQRRKRNFSGTLHARRKPGPKDQMETSHTPALLTFADIGVLEKKERESRLQLSL